MEEYGIMEYLELAVPRCGRWTGNREFIWSGLNACNYLVAFYGGDLYSEGITSTVTLWSMY